MSLTIPNSDDTKKPFGQAETFMRKLTEKDLRTRSFLVGSLGSQLSLGGKPELDYFFPERSVKVFIGTWNMAAPKTLPDEIENFFLPDYASSNYAAPAPHIFVFGIQESMSDKRKLQLKIQETIGHHFVCLTCNSLGTLTLIVFIRRELIWYTSAPIEATASTRPPQPIATKGTLGVSFELFGNSFLFLNSHFAAGEGNAEARIADYRRTISELNIQSTTYRTPITMAKPSFARSLFQSRRVASATGIAPVPEESPRRPISAEQSTIFAASNASSDITSSFDCCFWMGDFNFRVTKERHHVNEIIKGFSTTSISSPLEEGSEEKISSTSTFENLLDHDEMNNEMMRGRLFNGFQEGRIRFMPTYKFDVGTDNYDTSAKSRIQSYTDRIIYRNRRKNTITCLAYDSVDNVKTSDHRPLYAVYDVLLKPGLDSIPLGAGQFDRGVYLEGVRNRTHVVSNDKSSAVCSIQ